MGRHFCACPFVPARLAVQDQRQIVAHNEDGECHGHQERTHPKTPVAVHPMPVGTGVLFTVVAAMSFVEVPVSCHVASDCIVALRTAAVRESSQRTGATPESLWLGGWPGVHGRCDS